jgi:hypothetical protein
MMTHHQASPKMEYYAFVWNHSILGVRLASIFSQIWKSMEVIECRFRRFFEREMQNQLLRRLLVEGTQNLTAQVLIATVEPRPNR